MICVQRQAAQPPLADRFAQEVAELVEEADELPVCDVLNPLAEERSELRMLQHQPLHGAQRRIVAHAGMRTRFLSMYTYHPAWFLGRWRLRERQWYSGERAALQLVIRHLITQRLSSSAPASGRSRGRARSSVRAKQRRRAHFFARLGPTPTLLLLLLLRR